MLSCEGRRVTQARSSVALVAVVLLGCGNGRSSAADAGSRRRGNAPVLGADVDAGPGASSTRLDAGRRDAAASDARVQDGSTRDAGSKTQMPGSNAGSTLDAANSAGASPPVSLDDTWSPLSLIAIVNPLDHGAVGDGAADDLAALSATVAALPAAGGIVYFPEGKSFRKTDLLIITKAHVKLWAENRKSEIFQQVNGVRRRQSLLCRNTQGCGFFGLLLRSDATMRFDALEDNQISIDHGSDTEIVGNEIFGSAATGIMLYGSQRQWIEGNYIHHTWADHIHHTEAARVSWCWDNFIFNEDPSRGDDGIACVTYGPTSPRCGDMEWWHNTILKTGWGRGYSVIGGDTIAIHDNWAIYVAGAGVIVASEPSYNSASSNDITVRNNYVYRSGQAIGHPGILVSGLNDAADPLSNLTFTDNVSVETKNGQAFREEGRYSAVTNTGLSDKAADLPQPIPTVADVVLRDTSVLMTRDTSFVSAEQQRGLYRIHVRKNGTGFQQRFEYVLQGADAAMTAFIDTQVPAGAALIERRNAGPTAVALLLSPKPIAVSSALDGIAFADLRAGDSDGTLSWLWSRLNNGSYGK
jgi:hypothetical protein